MTNKLNQKYTLSNIQISSNLSNETVILNHHAGIYYGLNEVGTFVWEKLQEKPMTGAEIKELLLAEYDVDEQTVEEDLLTVLQDLINEKLVEIA